MAHHALDARPLMIPAPRILAVPQRYAAGVDEQGANARRAAVDAQEDRVVPSQCRVPPPISDVYLAD